MCREYTKNPDKFETSIEVIDSIKYFEKEYSIELRYFNSAGVVAANQGLPLSKMDKHSYEVYGEIIQVAKTQRELCKSTIENLVSKL
jgi:hypothetical protein